MRRAREEDGPVEEGGTRREDVIDAVKRRYDGSIDRVSDLTGQLGRLDDGTLYRAPSTVFQGKFPGLFSRRDYKAGDLVTWYSGARVSARYYSDVVKKEDPQYFEYARMLTGTEVALGNYTGDQATGTLRKVPSSELGDVFRGDGAGQFLNGGPLLASPEVNVGAVTIEERRRKIAADNSTGGDLIRAVQDLREAYPDSVISVSVALVDIPAGTELVTNYGPDVLKKMRGATAAAATKSAWRRGFGAQCIECADEANFACSLCGQAFYCSAACQEAHAESANIKDACLLLAAAEGDS